MILPMGDSKRVYVGYTTQDLFEETENLIMIVKVPFSDFGKHVPSRHILHNLTPFTTLHS